VERKGSFSTETPRATQNECDAEAWPCGALEGHQAKDREHSPWEGVRSGKRTQWWARTAEKGGAGALGARKEGPSGRTGNRMKSAVKAALPRRSEKTTEEKRSESRKKKGGGKPQQRHVTPAAARGLRRNQRSPEAPEKTAFFCKARGSRIPSVNLRDNNWMGGASRPFAEHISAEGTAAPRMRRSADGFERIAPERSYFTQHQKSARWPARWSGREKMLLLIPSFFREIAEGEQAYVHCVEGGRRRYPWGSPQRFRRPSFAAV